MLDLLLGLNIQSMGQCFGKMIFRGYFGELDVQQGVVDREVLARHVIGAHDIPKLHTKRL